MKTAKLAIGIVSIVLAVVVLFQSCAVGVGIALSQNAQDDSGSMGFMVTLLMVIAGIVGIVARKSKGGAIAATILYALAGIIGVTSSGMFADLIIWGIVACVFAAVFFISIFSQKYDKKIESPK